jgi:hypothetical protein
MKVCYKGKVIDDSELPDDKKVNIVDWTHEQFERRLMILQEKSLQEVVDEQFLYGPLRGNAIARDRARAKKEYWRGVSNEMNK